MIIKSDPATGITRAARKLARSGRFTDEALQTPRSLWIATSFPSATAPQLTENEVGEVAVIGAGYLGLSAALHLAEAGKAVVVLDAVEPGWGASGRNNGQVIPGLKIDPDATLRQLDDKVGERMVIWSGGAPTLVFDLIERFGLKCQSARNGWIQPAPSPHSARLIEKRCHQWRARGAPVEMLTHDRLSALLGTSHYLCGWLDRRGGWLNPLAYCRGLARAAQALGVKLHSHTPVLRLGQYAGGWIVHTPQAVLRARQVVIATGAYGGADLIKGLQESIVPIRTAQVATKPLPYKAAATILPGRQAVSDARRLLTSFRVTPDGRLVMGGAGATGGSEKCSLFRSLHWAAHELFGQLGRFEWEFGWSGRLALTTDHLPHLHEPERGLVTALGCNGRGIAISTALGKVIADRLLGAELEDLPIPITEIKPIPVHALCRFGVAAATQLKRLCDGAERWRSRDI